MQTSPEQGQFLNLLVRLLGAFQRGEVERIVKAREFGVGRHRRLDIGGRVEPAHGADEVGGGGDARDVQRMPGAEGRAAVDLAADIDRALAGIGGIATGVFVIVYGVYFLKKLKNIRKLSKQNARQHCWLNG